MILKKDERLPFAVFLVFFLLFSALIAATFGDLIISDKYYRGNGWFVSLFDIIGKAPGYLLLAFASSVLMRCVPQRKELSCYLFKYLYVLVNFGAMLLFVASITEMLSYPLLHYGVSAIGGLLFSIVNIGMIQKLPREKAKQLEKWSVLTVLLVGFVVVITAGLKFVWGRVRYNELISMGGEYAKLFTAWYKPQHAAGGDSFPSGHTALTACLFTLPLLLKSLKVNRWGVMIASVLCGVFIVVTPCTRIIGGYHYLSDVIISLGIAYTLFIVLYFLLFYRKSIYFTSGNKLERALHLGSERIGFDAETQPAENARAPLPDEETPEQSQPEIQTTE